MDTTLVKKSLLAVMKKIKEKMWVDFIGLGIFDVMNEEIRWRFALGNTNTRYKRIVIRMGKGIAGEVVQLNRLVKIENFPHDAIADPIEYPIMLVEHLQSAMAVPIAYGQRIFGVLLIGHRSARKYTPLEEEFLVEAGEQLGSDLEKANVYLSIEERNDRSSQEISLEYTPLIQFLNREQQNVEAGNRGHLTFEVLDQSIIAIPASLQQNLINHLNVLSRVLCQEERDRLEIIIGRIENAFTIESISNRSILSPKEVFQSIYDQIGEIEGTVFVHHEADGLRFVIEIPVWSYLKPL